MLEIVHRMRFLYDDFVRESQMELRVEPESTPHQSVQAFHLSVGPPPKVERYRDWNGNAVHHLVIRDYHDRIEVEARSLVEVSDDRPGLEALGDARIGTMGELLDFTLLEGPARGGERLDALARAIPVPPDAPIAEQVAAATAVVRERLRYESGVTDWRTSAEDALAAGSGVCQDFAHVMLGLLRRRGIPSRYVSGYLHVGTEREPAQSHAWVEVHGNGRWIGVDPTHDQRPDQRYVRIAAGRSYDDVPPNRGVFRGSAAERLETTVEFHEVEERDVAALQRSAPDLEVPVYSELPALSRPRVPGTEDQPAPVEEEQQQQQ